MQAGRRGLLSSSFGSRLVPSYATYPGVFSANTVCLTSRCDERPFVPQAGYKSSTVNSYHRWRTRTDKKKHLKRLKNINTYRQQKAAAEEAGEEEAPAEEATEGGETQAEEAAAPEYELDELGRPPTWAWKGHPYDYPWTEQEREELWFSEEELPRHLFDLINSEHGHLIEPVEEMEGDEDDEDEGNAFQPFAIPPSANTNPQDRERFKRALRSYRTYEIEDEIQELIEDYEEEHERRPCLSQETKDQIVELHTIDPVNWNLDSLSVKYGLSKARVKALLMFGKMEKVAEAHGMLLPDTIVEVMEDEFGALDRIDDKVRLEEHMEKIRGIAEDESIDGARMKSYLHSKFPRAPPPEELPEEPPQELVDLKESKILFEPGPNKPNKSRGLIIIDMDDERPFLGPTRQKKDDKTRLIWINEPSGLVRTPTWRERYWISRWMHPPAKRPAGRPYEQQTLAPSPSYLKHYRTSRKLY